MRQRVNIDFVQPFAAGNLRKCLRKRIKFYQKTFNFEEFNVCKRHFAASRDRTANIFKLHERTLGGGQCLPCGIAADRFRKQANVFQFAAKPRILFTRIRMGMPRKLLSEGGTSLQIFNYVGKSYRCLLLFVKHSLIMSICFLSFIRESAGISILRARVYSAASQPNSLTTSSTGTRPPRPLHMAS